MADELRPMRDLLRPVTTTVWQPLGPTTPAPSEVATATHRYCPTCDDAGFVQRRVAFGDPGFGRAIACPACNGPDPDANRETLWRLSGIAPHERMAYRFATFDTAQAPAMREAKLAAEAWSTGDGLPFLVLAGPVGAGKTHLATAAAGVCIGRDVATLVAVVPLLLSQLRDTQRPDYTGPALDELRRRCERYPALVLDDYGAGRTTEWAEEQLFLVLNERYRNRLRTLVTTNTAPDRIEERTRSRLCDRHLSRVVAASAPDYRLGGRP